MIYIIAVRSGYERPKEAPLRKPPGRRRKLAKFLDNFAGRLGSWLVVEVQPNVIDRHGTIGMLRQLLEHASDCGEDLLLRSALSVKVTGTCAGVRLAVGLARMGVDHMLSA
jgi:hypothetical protein